MSNIKQILREELLLNVRRNLLSEESINMINNPNHIKYVLGINVSLNEVHSLSIRKQIIEEQIILENMLTSINNFLGSVVDKGKEKAIQIVDSVKTLKDIALLIKDLILSPDFMSTAVNAIKKVGQNIITELENMVIKITQIIGVNLNGFSEKFKKLTDKIISTLSKLINGTGWKGFLSILGFCALVKYLEKSVLGRIMDGGVEFISANSNMMNGIEHMFNSFKMFLTTISGLDIQPILSWFTDIGLDTAVSSFFTGVDIINVLGLLLAPVIKSIHWGKKLVKK